MKDHAVIFRMCLRAWRQEYGLTFKEVAKKAGLSLSYIYRIEHGRTTPSLHTMDAISRVFGYTLSLRFESILMARDSEEIENNIKQTESRLIDFGEDLERLETKIAHYESQLAYSRKQRLEVVQSTKEIDE